jgi:hypothetical protein
LVEGITSPRLKGTRALADNLSSHRSVAIVVALLAAAVLTPATPAGACSLTAPAFTLTGPATAKQSHVVTFRVDKIESDFGTNTQPLPGGAPSIGSSVDVKYWDGDEQFLRVGNDYLVTAWSDSTDGQYGSGVHTAEDNCGGGGTVNADGTEIDTANRIMGLRVWIVYPIVVALTVVAGWIAVIVPLRLLTRRRRRLGALT